jgi:hypothetical protein
MFVYLPVWLFSAGLLGFGPRGTRDHILVVTHHGVHAAILVYMSVITDNSQLV